MIILCFIAHQPRILLVQDPGNKWSGIRSVMEREGLIEEGEAVTKEMAAAFLGVPICSTPHFPGLISGPKHYNT